MKPQVLSQFWDSMKWNSCPQDGNPYITLRYSELQTVLQLEKNSWREKGFLSNDDVITETIIYFAELDQSYYTEWINKLVQCWTNCTTKRKPSLKNIYTSSKMQMPVFFILPDFLTILLLLLLFQHILCWIGCIEPICIFVSVKDSYWKLIIVVYSHGKIYTCIAIPWQIWYSTVRNTFFSSI